MPQDDVRQALREGNRVRLFRIHGGTRTSPSFNYQKGSRIEEVPSRNGSPHNGFIPRQHIAFTNFDNCMHGTQVDFSGLLLSLSTAAARQAQEQGRVYLVDPSHTVVCVQMWQFKDGKPLTSVKKAHSFPNVPSGTITIVTVYDAFYGGRDRVGAHLCYCTEDTSVKTQRANRGTRTFGNRIIETVAAWCRTRAAQAIVDVLEDQVSLCTSISSQSGLAWYRTAAVSVFDKGAIRSGLASVEFCQPVAKIPADKLWVVVQFETETSVSNEALVVGFGIDQLHQLLDCFFHSAHDDRLSTIFRCLTKQGFCCVADQSYLATFEHNPDWTGCEHDNVEVAAAVRCALAKHRARILQESPQQQVLPSKQLLSMPCRLKCANAVHCDQNESHTDYAHAWAAMLLRAKQVTPAQATHLSCQPGQISTASREDYFGLASSSADVPFLQDEWAWICGQLNIVASRSLVQVLAEAVVFKLLVSVGR